ncbi:MAG: NAD(P)/FAD-dependent oxidoreductase [Ktedonobacteraceae bacterium]
MGSTSYWQAELHHSQIADKARLKVGPLEGDCESEVAIVGAGITGTAAALWLARAGLSVRVLEGRQIAAGASGRNAGFITGTTGEKYATVVSRYGRARARRLWNFHVHNARLATGILAELDQLGWQCDYRSEGMLGLAANEDEMSEVTASAALLNEDGWPTQIVTREALPKHIQAAYTGGIYHPDSAELQPARFVNGVALLAQQAGAMLHEETPVLSLAESEGGVILTTPRGTVHAGKLVLATNAWLPDMGAMLGAQWLEQCITPTRGQVIATEPVEEKIFPCPCSANEGYQYWRQLSDGRLVVGGWRNTSFATEATMDETPNEPVQRHLDAFVHETLGLAGVGIAARWAGIMAFTADGMPLIGRLPGSRCCYLAGGYTGHGNASALEAAQIISEMVQGREHPEADLFDPGRFVTDEA